MQILETTGTGQK